MPRKARIRVVLDTNVIVARFLNRRRVSSNLQVYNLWSIERRLQLIVSQPLIDEYLGTLKRLLDDTRLIRRFRARLYGSSTVTRLNLGKQFELSRDPADNMVLSTAHSGSVKYLVTNDRDLLEIPTRKRRTLRFEIVTSVDFLRALE